jgi:hypothetical protein
MRLILAPGSKLKIHLQSAFRKFAAEIEELTHAFHDCKARDTFKQA